MKVKLLQDQHYINPIGAQYCGFAGEIVDVDELFLKLIDGKYEEVVEVEDDDNDNDKLDEKPLDRMNKAELVEKAISVGIEKTEEEFEAMKKADIIKLIEEQI